MEKTGMLVRKLPVKLALETVQADGPNRAGWKQAKSRPVFMCVCLESIYQSIHDVRLVFDFPCVDPHSNDLRRNQAYIPMKELRRRGCHSRSRAEIPGREPQLISARLRPSIRKLLYALQSRFGALSGITEKLHEWAITSCFLFSSIASF